MKKIIAFITILLIITLTGCMVQLAIEPVDSSEQKDDVSDAGDVQIENGLQVDGKIVVISHQASIYPDEIDTYAYGEYYILTIIGITLSRRPILEMLQGRAARKL